MDDEIDDASSQLPVRLHGLMFSVGKIKIKTTLRRDLITQYLSSGSFYNNSFIAQYTLHTDEAIDVVWQSLIINPLRN
jgi:hypothetical protein